MPAARIGPATEAQRSAAAAKVEATTIAPVIGRNARPASIGE